MVKLDKDIRLFIEERIDAALIDANIEADFNKYLSRMGIEPNLETMLSFMTGTLFGVATGIWSVKKGMMEGIAEGPIESQEVFMQAVSELLARRAMELRQHFIQSRHM